MDLRIEPGWRPGAIGRIAALHGEGYARIAGFGVAFEALVAREVADVCEGLADGRDGLWLAVLGERIEGSVAIQAPHAPGGPAHLRWFFVSEALRGRGAGTALLGAALAFCRERGHDRVELWTFEGLDAARRLYERAGFVLVEQVRGARWGTEVTEQRFALRLAAA
ncbi:MAG: hypothetical protein RJA99_320 [Pseudomonadota bacterium]|jgi:GNAT superfamily N-acetyltransferase